MHYRPISNIEDPPDIQERGQNPMSYKSVHLNEVLTIDEIYSIHYFEYMSDFSFPGESHDFWEFLCVDKGEVNVFADELFHSLKKGDIIFHRPNEFHNVKSNGMIAPNLVVISFSCNSPAMAFLKKRYCKSVSRNGSCWRRSSRKHGMSLKGAWTTLIRKNCCVPKVPVLPENS